MAICRACPNDSENARKIPGKKFIRRDEHCIRCGCPLITKTKALNASCPLNMKDDGEGPRWVAVADDLQSFEITNAIENAEKHSDN